MVQRYLFQNRLSFSVADTLLCAKSRKAKSRTVNMQLQVPMVVVTHADAYLCLLQNAAQVLQHKEHGWTTCGALRAGESTAVSRSFLHVVRQDLRTPSARPALMTHKLPITMQARPRLCQRTHGLTVQASVISPSRFNQNWNCYDVMDF